MWEDVCWCSLSFRLVATFIYSRSHIRILHSGSKALDEGDSRNKHLQDPCVFLVGAGSLIKKYFLLYCTKTCCVD